MLVKFEGIPGENVSYFAKQLSELAENDTLYQVAEEVEKVMADEKKM